MLTMVVVEDNGLADAVGNEGRAAVVGKERGTRLDEFGTTNDQSLALVVILN